MKTSHRRIALLTGASIAALGLAAPALAVPHDGKADGTYPGVDSTADTLVICDLAVGPPAPDSPCFTGVIDSTNPAVAGVNSVLTGRIYQHQTGGDITMLMVNDGSAEVGAIAIATATILGAAAATATNFWGFQQYAIGAGSDVSLTLDNNGTFIEDAIASANGFTADANAFVHGGGQFIQGATTAAINFTNDGTFSALASANANGLGASADATVNFGFWQVASVVSGNASLDIANNDTINIAALAHASGLGADAHAYVNQGITQFASASGTSANVAVHNAAAGVINIDAIAGASGLNAVANATVSGAVTQDASGNAGASANALIDNLGAININAAANASGGTSAVANAAVATGLQQVATATGGGDATVTLNNGGSIDVGAVAVAVATAGAANAAANISDAVGQSASATSGDAFATMTNALAGTINIHATATATGDVGAVANISGGIRQEAHAGVVTEGLALGAVVPLFVTSTANDAFVSMTNAGAITVAANASVNDTGTGPATANAQITTAIAQTATATGNAGAFLDNSGSIAINAIANANAATGTAVVGGNALANATVDFAIQQNVNGSGTASASFTNSGTIAVGASAHAFGEGIAVANANVDNALYQVVTAGSTALATFHNGGSIALSAIAGATGAIATANAFAEYIMEQDVIGTSAAAVISNTGTMSLLASAAAVGTKSASAVATANEALVQDVSGTFASASIVNGGTINVSAIANATAASGSAYAFANVDSAIVQTVSGLSASAVFSNTGTIALNATAVANASTFASATASVSGVQQNVSGLSAFASAFNSGSIALNAVATAAGSSAFASANANGAIDQNVSGFGATASASNSGTIVVSASANATATSGFAQASASASSGVAQNGSGAFVSLVNTNNGSISIIANANANGATGASASASATDAMYQQGSGAIVSATMSNAGSATVQASANAVATAVNTLTSASASASAYALGMGQNLDGGALTGTIINSGSLLVSAVANASAEDYAFASATATGAFLNINGTSNVAVFSNAGTLTASASAVAVGASGTAFAEATGYDLDAGGIGAGLSADVTNSGSLLVNAFASAPDFATAHAMGMTIAAHDATGTGPLSGTVLNSGTMTVVASAVGGNTTAAITPGSVATATGILVTSGLNTATITNSGSLLVDAITANGGPATANGIVVVGNGAVVVPALTDIVTINNSGDLIVRQSIDGGATFTRGMAIDVALAPNPAVINLLGGGNIYGNIDIEADDVINVDNGETSFDGIVNPECMPPVYDGIASICGQGVLNITADGNLFLRDNINFNPDYDGPAYVFVDTFNVAAGGTLTYELPVSTTGGTQPIGSYPEIFTDTANLAGNLRIRPNTSNGLFADDYFFDNVIDANTRVGTFDTCALDGTFADSAFLTLTCIYDAANNVDLGLERTPFDAIPGLTHNQASTAFGLECIFDPTLTGGMADVLADIFTFNATDYKVALDQLGGAAYAQYLSSFNSLGVHYNDILAKATDCEVPALAGSSLECRTSPTHIWAQVDFQNRKTDGDIEAGGYDADRWTAILGFDASVGNAAIIGASIGKVTNRLDFSQFNNKVNADGYQVGLYGVFDPGAFYVKALGTYSWFDGDSTRRIDFRPFGGTVNGLLHGDPDVRLWTLGLHGGYRIAMGATSAVTPYLNLDYTSARLRGFTETGLVGPELTVLRSTEKRTTLTGGVKWAGDIGGVVPEVDLGYRYQFGDRRSNVTNFFLGDADCAFDIISENEKRGAFLAGLSLGGKAGPVDVRVSYQGLFNGQSTSHGGNFKIVLPFGGHAAPPPPPPEPVVAPPPPPPPPVEVAPPPPPPPPPPAPSGERG